jgi:hypothetical protein
MTNPNLTEIICVIDRSGSMAAIRDDAIGGFNTFLEEQKKIDKPCNLTYVQFDDEYEVVHNGVPIKDVSPLTPATFVPRGWTALLDAIGRTIDTVGMRLMGTPENQRPGKVIFVILTDGEENSSREYKRSLILEMITRQREKYNWEFVFLAANQDAISVGREMGIQYAANFTPDSAHVGRTYSRASKALTNFRNAPTIIKARSALSNDIQDEVAGPEESQNNG